MFDFEIKQLNKSNHELIWIKNIKWRNWKLKINWIQITIKFASNLLFFKIDFFSCRKSKFLYKNNLSCDIICFNISLTKNTWKTLIKSCLIQNYVSSTMFRKSITFTFLHDIWLWFMKNKSINEKKRILTRLWIKKFKTFAKTSKMIRTRKIIMNDIKIKMTIIFKSIIVQHDINFFKHIDNMNFQQLWKLCDFENYEIIFEIMRECLKLRKNEFIIKKLFLIEFFYSYKRFVIQSFNYFDWFMK